MNDRAPLPRALSRPLERALRTFPVVLVSGSRQTGKSTLVRSFPAAKDRTYLTLDDVETLEQARTAPDALVAGRSTLTLDEVQRAPELLRALKRAVDERRTAGRFVLTGSANLLLMKNVAETLAGRVLPLTLWPMSLREQDGRGEPGAWPRLRKARDAEWLDVLEGETARARDWQEDVRRGGYPTPALHLSDAEDREAWFRGFTSTYLERDLRDLTSVASLVDFRRLMRAVCLRIGGLVNQTEIARDVGLSQPTVHRHLDLLEVSYQLVRVPAFAENRTKRLIKAPKAYWCDSGLAMHLAGESKPRGAHLENLVLGDLLVWGSSDPAAPQVHHWRAVDGTEVDFVVEVGDRLLPVEVKASARPRLGDAKGLATFRAEHPRRSLPGVLLHTGTETSWLATGVLATPWWRVIG